MSVTFALPPELSADRPPESRGLRRDEVRLLVADDRAVWHARFRDLGRFLNPGDLVVVNTSGTLAAAVHAGAVVLHFSAPLDDGTWVVEVRRPDQSGPVRDAVAGSVLRGRWPLSAYQTVFAREPGSAEMPSAGRPFTAELVTGLVSAGVAVAPITLHTGVSSLDSGEPPQPERFRVPEHTASLVGWARAHGGRVVAVGTTAARALESATRPDGSVGAGSGWTDLVLGPERPARVVTGLVTGLHEPEASHLLLLEAVAGRELVQRAYDAAVQNRYLWHEFGDSCLLLPASPMG
ncbi:MAG: queuosine biosynthesis protein [Actinobacteria bacterium 13_2_20CM_2_72_6]|nr:MAG: queuosine biosynthesis protein [Actinobacteria bacterium 13_2_20CM_2_72_6]